MRPQKSVPGNYWTPMGSLITPIISAKTDPKVEGGRLTVEKLQELLVACCDSIRK